MTREDAIKTLHELWRETIDHWYKEVFTMAIEALEEPTESVTDCISRERAIEIVKRAETKEIAYSALINLEPKEIPTCDECRLPECLADKQDDWITVSERLPSNNGYVLVTIDDDIEFGKYEDGEWSIWVCEHWDKWDADKWDAKGTTAWMPLPEPYREDCEE